ncbi:MAG TPA: FecR family protein [Chloroflexota bacterium]|jgi:hypothetical protein
MRGLIPPGARRWLALGLAVGLLGIAGAWLATRRGPPAGPVGKLYLVADTTLLTLQGEVAVQSAGAAGAEPVTEMRPLRLGDHVRTGPSGYAAITYADGSSTSLGPGSELLLDALPPDVVPGAAGVLARLLAGSAWTTSGTRGGAYPGVVVWSGGGYFLARGGQFTVEAAPDGTTTVTTAEGLVEGHTEAGDVGVPSGFRTRVRAGTPPEVPVPLPAPPVVLQISVQGPVSALLTDARGRSVGYHPDAEPFVSQVPGARLSAGGRGAQVFTVPDPVESYTLTLRGQTAGQTSVTVEALVNGGAAAGSSVRLDSAVAERQVLGAGFGWRDGAVRDVRALTAAAGPPPTSAIALLARVPGEPAPMPPTAVPVVVSATNQPTTAPPPAEPEPASPEAAQQAAPAEVGDAPTVAPPEDALARAPAAPPAEPAAPLAAPAASGSSASAPAAEAAPPPAPATEVPLAVGVVVEPATPEPTNEPTVAPTATPVPATPAPPTAVPTVPPPLPTPTPTPAPSRVVPAPRPTVASQRPAIAPTATPYHPPVAPAAGGRATPTRCLYPSC